MIFLVPFALVWCGGSIGMLYGRQIVTGKFELFTSLFGIPFLLGAVLLLTMVAMAMAMAGRVEVRKRGSQGEVFAGIGAIGWTRRFSWPDRQTIEEEISYIGRNRQRVVVLRG